MTEPALSKRERQIMDIVFRLGEASAATIHAELPDPPTYTAVRTMMRLLEEKGFLQHRVEGRKYIYAPSKSPMSAGKSALNRVLDVFFGGSLEDALAAHFSDPELQLDEKEIERLRALIDQAQRSSPSSRRPKSKRRK